MSAMTSTDLPITQEQLKEVAEQLQSSINEVRTDVGRIERTQDKILDTVQRIESQLKQWHDIPERLTRVEHDVAELKARR